MIRRLAVVGVELLVAFFLLGAGGLLWASHYVGTEEFRSLFTDILSRTTGREVRFVGDIKLNLWPEILLEIDDLALGEAPEFGDEPFAHFDTVHINVKVLPLLARKIMIESVFVDGLRVAVITDKEGKFNVESLFEITDAVKVADDVPTSSILDGWTFSLSNIEIINTEIHFYDKLSDRKWRLSGISLRTGEIQADAPVPVTIESGFSWEAKGLRADFALAGLVSINSDLSDLHLGDATLTASVYGDFLPKDAEPGQLTSQVTFDWENRAVALDGFQAQFLGLRAEGSIKSGDLREELAAQGHVSIRPFSPAAIFPLFMPDMSVGSVDGLKSSAFASFFHIDETGVRFDKIVATLDDITVRGDLGMTGFLKPSFAFDLRSSTIDLDRYLPLFQTGTPFVWSDFNLPLFRAFKGQGSIRLDGLKVESTLLSDIRLKVKADKFILIDAGAIKKGQASVGGSVEVSVGTDPETKSPTLALKARIHAESSKDGFAFLKRDRMSFGGAGTIALDFTVPAIVCPSEKRSMDILNHLSGSMKLKLLNGIARFKGETEEIREVPYAEAVLKADVAPGRGPTEYWSPVVAASLLVRGNPDVEAVSVNVQGPVSLAWDESRVASSGLSVSGSGSLAVLPVGARRANVSARIAYDSATHAVGVEDGFVQVLETILTGRGVVTGLNDAVETSGEIAVQGANPRRIIVLLTGEDFPTRDPEALQNWSLACRFAADEQGFTLSEARGDVDGMAVTGHVVGTGWPNPMLSFSLTGGHLDIDRYRPPSAEHSLEEKRSGKHVKAPPVKLPMDFLGVLRLNGKVVLEELKLAKVRAHGVTGEIRADNGQIHVSKVLATSYEGALTADWKGRIGKDFLTTHLLLHVEDLQAGPLTRDLGGREYIRGLADVDIDLTSQGATDHDILANLNGKVRTRVTNGSFKFSGFPIEGKITPGSMTRQEIAKMEQRAKARTSFQKAVSDFSVANGVFSADRFRVEAPPILQAYGEGGFSLPDNTINLAIRNDFVAVPSVTLQLEGRLSDPEVSTPTGKIVNDTVSNILSLPLKSLKFLRDLF